MKSIVYYRFLRGSRETDQRIASDLPRLWVTTSPHPPPPPTHLFHYHEAQAVWFLWSTMWMSITHPGRLMGCQGGWTPAWTWKFFKLFHEAPVDPFGLVASSTDLPGLCVGLSECLDWCHPAASVLVDPPLLNPSNALRCGSRFPQSTIDDKRQLTPRGCLSLLVLAAAADGLHGIWRPARAAAVIELHGISGCEVPVAAWCAETCPMRREECFQIGDQWFVGSIWPGLCHLHGLRTSSFPPTQQTSWFAASCSVSFQACDGHCQFGFHPSLSKSSPDTPAY